MKPRSTHDLDSILAALQRDYSKLSPRIRRASHSVKGEWEGVTLHLHYPAFRQGAATVQELVDALVHYLTPFALPRSEIAKVYEQYGKISAEDFSFRTSQLFQSAVSLFKRANEATNRNGEAGELILFLLTEWIIGAPQLIAKMSLKTNREMPVHGADGVHARYCPKTSKLLLYWGESKLYGNVGQAISAAVESITDALDPEKLRHELELVQRNIDFSGLDDIGKAAILRHLDPYDDSFNERHDVTTCLIGFDFDAFKKISAADGDKADEKFCKLAESALSKAAQDAAQKLKAAGLADRPIELFFLPLPSVKALRDLFQKKIGWKE
ncbi:MULTISPECIES: HamA C-terminal domain-containing protein [Bradyrhizobium]|uniref:HamA C-terminal domain-containing protein n=1 Tax=Bradyrhizobium TaxID=374 RepID=UPI0012F485D7|nr:DUF1837 domain-containing protein [Bradyrhizobium sp. CCBAU 15544]